MARIARVVVPGRPHPITQRGDRRQLTFFCADDYGVYFDLMAQRCDEEGVRIWASCLMPNHVHLLAVPTSEVGLRDDGSGRGDRWEMTSSWLDRNEAGVASCATESPAESLSKRIKWS